MKYVPYIAALMSLMPVNFAAFAHDGVLFPSNTDMLPTPASIKELILANKERLQSDDFSVMADDEPILTTNDTLWGAYAQCLCDSIRIIHDIGELKILFGISDAGSGENVTLVSTTAVIACKISHWCDRILYDESLKTDLRSVRCIRKVAQ